MSPQNQVADATAVVGACVVGGLAAAAAAAGVVVAEAAETVVTAAESVAGVGCAVEAFDVAAAAAAAVAATGSVQQRKAGTVWTEEMGLVTLVGQQTGSLHNNRKVQGPGGRANYSEVGKSTLHLCGLYVCTNCS